MEDTAQGQQTVNLFSGNLETLLQGFLIERQSRKRAAGTLAYYTDELHRFFAFLAEHGIDRIEDIQRDHVRLYLIALGQRRNKGGVFVSFRAIRSFMNWYEEDYEPQDWKNPVHKVTPPSPNTDPLPGVEIDTINKMIAACIGVCSQRNKTILAFLLDTGVRAQELIGLNVGDVDQNLGTIYVRHGKGDKPRTVVVSPMSLKKIRRMLKQRGQCQPEEPLFVSKFGTRFTYNGLTTLMRELSKKAGVKRPGLHDFRRAFAIAMWRKKCDLILIARLMGHKDLRVLKRYLAFTDDDLRTGHDQGNPTEDLKT